MMERLLRAARDAIVLRDDTGIMLLSDSSRTLFGGCDITEMEGSWGHVSFSELTRWVDDQVHPEDAKAVRAFIDRAAATPSSPVVVEYRRRGPDDSWIWMECQQFSTVDQETADPVTIDNHKDISAAKNAEIAAEHARLLVEQTMLDNSALLGMLAHDMRTPLTSVQGYADLITSATLTPEETLEMATIIRREATRLSRIINQMLQIEQLESGNYVPEREAADPGLVVRQAIDGLLGGWPGRTVSVEIAPDISTQWIDEDALSLIVTNLVANALKYSPGGGIVSVSLVQNLSHLLLTVSDHGIGIDPSQVDTIFNRYNRSDRAREHMIEGIGLGLPIVRRLARALGGDAWAENRTATGAVLQASIARMDEPADTQATTT